MKTVYGDIEPFTTKDGSVIRELMHPNVCDDENFGVSYCAKNQSLAEATVSVGSVTMLHKHRLTEELYHITSGEGLLTLGENQIAVTEGDTICIPPGTPHRIENTGNKDLKILCCCSPAYSHNDTQLLDNHSV